LETTHATLITFFVSFSFSLYVCISVKVKVNFKNFNSLPRSSQEHTHTIISQQKQKQTTKSKSPNKSEAKNIQQQTKNTQLKSQDHQKYITSLSSKYHKIASHSQSQGLRKVAYSHTFSHT